MFTTGLMQLHLAGKVTNRSKGQFDGVSVTTFAAGTAELYEWLDENHEVAFLPVDVVNAPDVIARNRSMVTINGALSVDLHGQVVADTIGGRQFSGIGGHEDFIAPSGLSLDDRSLVCLRSTVGRRRRRASRASCPRCPRAGSSRRPATSSTSSSPSTASRTCGAARSASAPGRWPRSPHPSSATSSRERAEQPGLTRSGPARRERGEPVEPLGARRAAVELHREPVDPELGEHRVVVGRGERREADRERRRCARSRRRRRVRASRRAASSSRFVIAGVFTARAAAGGFGNGDQPSPSSTARRIAAVLLPPIQIGTGGGCGSWVTPRAE